MEPTKTGFVSIDDYISHFPPDVQEKMNTLRRVIKEAAPEATERINYQMPTFDFHGNLVHFAGYKHHIGFYPAASGIRQFEKELSKYKSSKGAVQFRLDQPLPFDLVAKIVKFRVEESMEKVAAKALLKKKK